MLGNVRDRLSSLASDVGLDRDVLLRDARGEEEGRGLSESFDSCLGMLRGVEDFLVGDWVT